MKFCEDEMLHLIFTEAYRQKVDMKELANRINVTQGFMTQLRNGSKNWNTKLLAKFERALNIKLTYSFRIETETE
jgi:ribosome-binding protein aMBF1 (putative translation factor)